MGVPNKRTLTKTRRYRRDLDQIKADILSPKHLKQFKDTKAPEDLPGLGRHYCTECAKWFDMENTLISHKRGKPHKRRAKQLQEEPYTQRDAEAAVGLWVDNKRPVKTATGDVEMA
ncbi:zinc finger protein [Coniella lustricola]|uniref:Zinc finger protein n=1 Tax=Coniella lustricola TaxID=2025994 RepID=A0A2T3ADF5_9PEZI|nr:zinc finger protein [Coniella lustricola]